MKRKNTRGHQVPYVQFSMAVTEPPFDLQSLDSAALIRLISELRGWMVAVDVYFQMLWSDAIDSKLAENRVDQIIHETMPTLKWKKGVPKRLDPTRHATIRPRNLPN